MPSLELNDLRVARDVIARWRQRHQAALPAETHAKTLDAAIDGLDQVIGALSMGKTDGAPG